MKTKIYNLIILDESGSMQGLAKQTISGCNETIATIQSAQRQYADTQDHYVSIYAFQTNPECPSRYLIKNETAASVVPIGAEQYRPYGSTPLYDAVGSTLIDLKATVATCGGMAIGSVTIITDGYENSSKCYTSWQVARMISQLKEMGWNFNFIGANIDVQEAASKLNIDNCMAFEQTEVGTAEMFRRERQSRMSYYGRASEAIADGCAVPQQGSALEEMRRRLKRASADYFDQSDSNEKA